MRNFNQIFRKDITYNNIKVTKNQDFILSLKYKIFEKPLEGVLLTPPEFLESKWKFVVIKTKKSLEEI